MSLFWGGGGVLKPGHAHWAMANVRMWSPSWDMLDDIVGQFVLIEANCVLRSRKMRQGTLLKTWYRGEVLLQLYQGFFVFCHCFFF